MNQEEYSFLLILQVLQLDEKQADAVACELEHVVPPHVIRRWGQFVLYLRTRDFWKNWQQDYQAERKQLLHTMAGTFHNMGSLDSREECVSDESKRMKRACSRCGLLPEFQIDHDRIVVTPTDLFRIVVQRH